MSATARYRDSRTSVYGPTLSRAECDDCGWHGRSYRYRGSAEWDATRHNQAAHQSARRCIAPGCDAFPDASWERCARHQAEVEAALGGQPTDYGPTPCDPSSDHDPDL